MRTRILLLLACMPFMTFGQDREAAIWHYGEFGGLDFNSLMPVSVNTAVINTFEGSATIATEEGQLQFYTDGVSVYNRYHTQIANGQGLLGGQLSTQSAIIIPKPSPVIKGQPKGAPSNLYYVFTVGELRQVNLSKAIGEGLNYYTVSMADPNGVVGPQPTHLLTYDPDIPYHKDLKCSEKITAIEDRENRFYWVVTHFEDTFYAFRVDERGVNASPVTSKVGPQLFLGGYAANGGGQMKISPDGTRLAMANFQNATGPESLSPGSLYVFNFDIATGKVSNPKKLLADDFVFAYGVEFSPDSKKLYASVSSFRYHELPITMGPLLGSSLFQIDLQNNNMANRIYGSSEQPSALQQAIDGKIYKAKIAQRLLGVINRPNASAANVQYADEGLSIGRSSNKGLPSFVQSYFQVRIEYEEACVGEPTLLYTNYLPEPDAIAWDFGDGSRQTGTLDKELTHVYNAPGNYQVVASIERDGELRTIHKEVKVRSLPSVRAATLTQCDNDGDGISVFNLFEAAPLINSDPDILLQFYYSEADAENEVNEITRGSVGFINDPVSRVYARVENEFGCHRVTTIDLEVQDTSIPQDFLLTYSTCDDLVGEKDQDGIGTFNFSDATDLIKALYDPDRELNISYFSTEADALSERGAIDPSNYRNIVSPFRQLLWVRVEGTDDHACLGLAPLIELTVNPVPRYVLKEAETVCRRQFPYLLSVENPQETYTYQWFDASGNVLAGTPYFEAEDAGEYYVIATTTNGTYCETTREIKITAIEPPRIQTVEVEGDISYLANATVELEDENGYEVALDDPAGPYQDSRLFTEVAPGIHKVFVRDKNGCETISQEFSVIGYPAFFTPNNDGINDYWQLQGVSETLQSDSVILIFDRYGSLMAQVSAASEGWDGLYNGQLLPSSDYWFRITLEDGRDFNGHFSLKR